MAVAFDPHEVTLHARFQMTGTSAIAPPEAKAPAATDHWAALTASFLGWTLDAFDFFLVVMCLTAIAKEFGRPDKDIAFTLTVTLAFRPVGAFIFGLLADRYGRRVPLMIDLVFYSIIEILSGFAPNLTTFLILRALFGIGMGGEWGVGASLAMEKVPPRLRGVLSGLLQEGYAAGYLLAAGCYWLVFPRWGWRPMFFIGGLPALLALFVRYRVKESEVWERTRRKDWSPLWRYLKPHLKHYPSAGVAFCVIDLVLRTSVGSGVATPTHSISIFALGLIAAFMADVTWHVAEGHRKLFLYLTLLMAMMNFVSHGTQDMYPTFLKRQWNFSPSRIAGITALSMVGAIAGGIIFGLFSDRFGRRRAIVSALLMCMLAIPLWAFSPTVGMLVAGAFVMQFMVQGAWGVIPAHITELSPDSVRGFLPGFAYQCGVLIAGSVAYIEAVFAERMTYSWAMSLTAVTVFSLGATVAALGRERHGVAFGS